MVRYFVNFWVWWYVVNAFDLYRWLIEKLFFVVGYMNLPAMATNLFVPLYQDTSIAGKFISLLIRTVWIAFGSVIALISIIPMIAVYLVYLLLPFMPIFALLGTFIKWY